MQVNQMGFSSLFLLFPFAFIIPGCTTKPQIMGTKTSSWYVRNVRVSEYSSVFICIIPKDNMFKRLVYLKAIIKEI